MFSPFMIGRYSRPMAHLGMIRRYDQIFGFIVPEKPLAERPLKFAAWMSQEVSKWLVNVLEATCKWGILGL